MSDVFTRLAPWVRDVGLAYAGGLVLGAPVAAVVTWATGTERLATWCLLVAMAVVLRTLRQQRRPADLPGPATPRRRTPAASTAATRHAA